MNPDSRFSQIPGHRWLLILASVFVSGSAYYISTGLHSFWPAAWLAPVPILALAPKSSRRVAAAAAVAAFVIGSLNLFSYLARVIPLLILAGLLLIPALAFAAAVLGARWAIRSLHPMLAVFTFPVMWTGYEFLVSQISPHGTALSLAYSQVDCLPVLQIVSLTGIWGLTFVLTLFPSAIAVAWVRRAPSALIPSLAIVLLVFGYGAARLQEASRGPSIRVGLAAAPDDSIAAAFETDDPGLATAVAREYAARVGRLAGEGAQIVVLPEKLVGVIPADSEEVSRIFSNSARAGHVTVVAGVNRVGVTPLHNVAVVYGPNGRVLLEYEKHHLLPGPETGYEVGLAPGLFSGAGNRWGTVICKDMDFPPWLRRYGRQDIRMLAVPAWDFVVDGRMHSRMAVVRAVENGFTLVRAASQGLLTICDAWGRILAEDSTALDRDVLLIKDAHPGPGTTVYSRTGDWFGWLDLALLVLGLPTILVRFRGPIRDRSDPH